jgi:hypothetical protein
MSKKIAYKKSSEEIDIDDYTHQVCGSRRCPFPVPFLADIISFSSINE